MEAIRHDWTLEEIEDLLNTPLLELVHRAQTVHRDYQPANAIQLATLLSVKTGGCSENCAYCPQSAHYNTEVDPQSTLPIETVLEQAERDRKSVV